MPTRVTQKAWFGPKRLVGWGWSPTSWEGYAASVAFVAAFIGVMVFSNTSATGLIVGAVLVVGFLVLVLLTGDPPGGPKR